MGDPAIEDEFFYRFPVSMCILKGSRSNPQLKIMPTNGGPGVIVAFTDKDLASRFMIAIGDQNVAEVIECDQTEFVSIVTNMNSHGAGAVGFDPDEKTGVCNVVIDIQDLIDQLKD